MKWANPYSICSVFGRPCAVEIFHIQIMYIAEYSTLMEISPIANYFISNLKLN